MRAEFPVPGLAAPVEILVDGYGVPHLYADNEPDLFCAQGFNAARDRLFQLDLWRRRGLGRLAEVFGPGYVARDRAARLFLYRGDLRAEWLAYGDGVERTAAAFVAGVNAYIALCDQRPELLPAEFDRLGYRPAPWEPTDIAVIRSHGLYANLEQEVARARTLRDFGPGVEDLRRAREPHRELVVPEGLDLADIPDDVLDVYRLATTRPTFDGPDLPLPRVGPEGSNAWVVGSGRTATGRPLLANDPHRAVEVPSLRYLAHLSAPGFDVIGAGEPALPGISIGHNGHLAFGLTIFAIDQEDLYVYRTNPDAPDEYRYADRWEPMRVTRELIGVADGAPVDAELRFTRHGPVIHEDRTRNLAFAVRAAWLEPGMAPYLGSLAYLRARDADAFVDALDRWGSPGENQVYATPGGTIGWRPAGLVPVRPNWDGTLPVPGDGRYEWAGFRAPDLAERDPARDWIATANECNVPVGSAVSCEWEHRFRHDRIGEVLAGASGLTVADCVRLQADTVNVTARPVLAALRRIRAATLVAAPAPDLVAPPHRRPGPLLPSAPGVVVATDPTGTAELVSALELLDGWDCDETRDSAAAAFYQVWARRHLRPALLRDALAGLVGPGAVQEALDRLTCDEVLGSDVRADLTHLAGLDADRPVLEGLLSRTLVDAWADAAALLGGDPTRWRWGALHRAAPAHPLSGWLGPDWAPLPVRERGGSGDTVMCADYDPAFRQTDGATFRIVVDVGDWDGSRAMNAPGQSGRPGDRHFDDLYPAWAADGSFPLYYSRAAVEAHTVSRYLLVPPG
ncbi:penicillin acylase family protein [Longispora urticae]